MKYRTSLLSFKYRTKSLQYFTERLANLILSEDFLLTATNIMKLKHIRTCSVWPSIVTVCIILWKVCKTRKFMFSFML